ncbi:MAG: hypothetical protein JXR13_15460 [Thalassovita sp.]
MVTRKHVEFCLEQNLKNSAAAGKHNFIGKVSDLLEKANFTVHYRDAADYPDGYALVHEQEPVSNQTLTLERCYHPPFWTIEKTSDRWEWDVAKTPFRADKVEAGQAEKFYSFWQGRLFGEATNQTAQDGYIYVPLQTNLSDRAPWQTCTPFEMLVSTLQYDPSRRILASLDPEVTYSSQDRSKLKTLVGRFPRLEVRSQTNQELLQRCDYVVTQNSAQAFDGYFFGKPCVLFARSDFHHIAGDVFTNGPEAAFKQVQGSPPPFAKYIWWFWQEMSINAGRDQAKNKIRKALRRGGWPI